MAQRAASLPVRGSAPGAAGCDGATLQAAGAVPEADAPSAPAQRAGTRTLLGFIADSRAAQSAPAAVRAPVAPRPAVGAGGQPGPPRGSGAAAASAGGRPLQPVAGTRAAQGGPPVGGDAPGARRLASPRPPVALVGDDGGPLHLAARQKAVAGIHRCWDASWEESTRDRYDATLRSVVSTVEQDTALTLLPCDADTKVMTLFAGMIGQPWGTIGAAKAAVRAWHVQRDCLSTFDAAWTSRTWHFWRGLKKLGDHTLRQAKRPFLIGEALAVQRARLAQASDAGVRDAAMVGAAFFGIRRFAEIQALLREDVVFQDDAVECRIRRQKNDPHGAGMLIWIPRLPQLGPLCPAELLRAWAARREAVWGQAGGQFFCVTGAAAPRAVSADTFRRMLSRHVRDAAVGSHSLRKGGAMWWRHTASLPESLVQGQGGWSSLEVMRAFYTKYSDADRRGRLLEAAGAALALRPRAAPPRQEGPGRTSALPVWKRPL